MNDKILDINYQFGKRIKFLRNIRKISQEELAFSCELNTKYYRDIERGRRNKYSIQSNTRPYSTFTRNH